MALHIATAPAALLKLDGEAVNGLTSTSNSLAYRLGELDRHFHSRERWVGIHAAADATHWGGSTLTPFLVTSGLGAYGVDANDEALVLGTDDTPVIGTCTHFDINQIAVTLSDSTTVWKLRIIYGTGTMADAIAAFQFTETMVKVASQAGRLGTALIRMPRALAETQVWVQGMNASDDGTLSFFVGFHEYEG